MLTLTYLLKQMEDNDPSEDWFQAIADNFAAIDAHNHNGVNSPLLTSAIAVALTTQTLLAAAWVALGDGRYRQLVTLPTISGTPLQYDNVSMEFKIASTGHVIYPTVEKASANTYYVYSVDNTLDFTALYST
jgi:hypothetical protein